MTSNSSILFESSDSTTFLIDIPTSISLAQELPSTPELEAPNGAKPPPTTNELQTPPRKHILSSEPLKEPYPVKNEPKSETARARVLARIPEAERETQLAVQPLVLNTLNEIKGYYPQESEWCLPRHILEEKDKIQTINVPENAIKKNEHATWAANYITGKRKRAKTRGALLKKAESRPKIPDDQDSQIQIHPEYFEHGVACKRQYSRPVPPLILSPGTNRFEDEEALCNNVVKNTSSETAVIEIRRLYAMKSYNGFTGHAPTGDGQDQTQIFIIVPPLSNFILCNLPLESASQEHVLRNPIPGLSRDKKFHLIVFDPPWANKSVRRSGHYQTQTYLDSGILETYIKSVLEVHSYQPIQGEKEQRGDKSNQAIAAIWITNSAKARKVAHDSLLGAGFSICEEWTWVKTTVSGEPVTPLEGIWRKPYEVLLIGKRGLISGDKDDQVPESDDVLRRVIAAVPDVHSRKPNLKEIFERVFFKSEAGPLVEYSALEVFARNLTAGWWASGNEVLKFNSEEWWVDD